ncbi:hypothetical protein AGMMS49975_22350 [Clostridia bacterium]|nr:hypothetical protein AGMMS49975_22350 [Clostridia bacterium]
MRNYPEAEPYRWSAGMVSNVLKREEYMGWCVLNKTVKETYKSKRVENAPENRLIFKNSHPAIVDEEIWNVVQRLRGTKRVPQRVGGEPNPLTGVLYCSDCGQKLFHKQGKTGRTQKPHDEYCCSSYRHYTRSCTMHYIRVEVIENLILETIRRVSKFVRNNKAEFIERVREMSAINQESAVKENRKKLAKSKRRRDETDTLIKKLYENFALEKIPEEIFSKLLAEYSAEQKILDEEISRLQTEIDTYTADSVRADSFIELVNRYTEFTEFSATLLNEFVQKVVIHEADKSSGQRIQKVDIYLNFIGNFDLPPNCEDDNALSEEEVIRTSKKKRRCEMSEEELSKEREIDRRHYAKKRAKRIADEQAQRAAILQGTSYAV